MKLATCVFQRNGIFYLQKLTSATPTILINPKLHIKRCFSIGVAYHKELTIKPSVVDTLEYADKEFYMLDYAREKNKELIPVLPSIEEKLMLCDTPVDVLTTLLNDLQQNTFRTHDVTVFWKYLYFQLCNYQIAEKAEFAFRKRLNIGRSHDSNNSSLTSKDIFNNVMFQRLIFETLVNSQNLLTQQVSQLLFYLRYINVPLDSFVFTHVLSILKERINELIPQDVVWSLQATENITEPSIDISTFHEGVIMHLENQVLHPILKTTLIAPHDYEIILHLLLSPLIVKSGSEELKKCLIESCLTIFKFEKMNRMDGYKAKLILDAAKTHSELLDSALYNTAMKFRKRC